MPDPAPEAVARLRVLVVDADDRVRESLSGLLAIGGRLTVVGSAGRASEALQLAATARPDVVVVDPRLPDVDGGIAFFGRLRATMPATRILAMSWSDTLEATVRSAGADGFVRKTFRPADLVAAVVATADRPGELSGAASSAADGPGEPSDPSSPTAPTAEPSAASAEPRHEPAAAPGERSGASPPAA